MYDDELREVVLSSSDGDVRAMTVTSDYCLWISSTGAFYMWDRRQTSTWADDGADTKGELVEGPRCLATLGLSPPPHLIAATEDGEVVVANGTHAGFYTIERQLRPDDADALEYADSSPNGLPALVDDVVLREVFLVPCRVRDASHLSLSRDGGTAALSSPSELVLVHCRAIAAAQGESATSPHTVPVPDSTSPSHASAFGGPTAAPASLLRVDTSEWFGLDGTGSGSPPSPPLGCSRTCFASPTELVVLSAGHHLVRVAVGWTEGTVWLERDGHVVTRAHRVLALSCREDVLAVGLSDGSVKLLRADTLDTFKSVDVLAAVEAGHERQAAAEAHRRDGAAARVGEGAVTGRKARASRGLGYGAVERRSVADAATGGRPPLFSPLIAEVSVGRAFVVVLMSDAVLRIRLDTLAVDEASVWYLVDEDQLAARAVHGAARDSPPTHLSTCAGDGSWSTYSVVEGRLQYYVAAPMAVVGGRGGGAGARATGEVLSEDEGEDVVHAQTPLPPKWRAAAEAMVSSSGNPTGSRPQRASAPLPVTKGVGTSKPVTFGHAIRSSGYGQQVPWSVQQERKRAAALRARQPQLRGGTGAGPLQYAEVQGSYESHPFVVMASTNRTLASETAVHRSAVLSSTFTAAGDGLLTTSSSGGYVLKLPVSKFRGAGVSLKSAFPHDGASPGAASASGFLTSAANLSLHAPLIATGSADGVLQLWRPSPAVAGARGSTGRRTSGGLRGGEAPVVTHRLQERKEVRSVRFFYMDKFLAYSAGAAVSFRAYSLDERRRESRTAATDLDDALNRFRNTSFLGEPVYSYTADAQHVTSMDCVNHFASSLVVLAGSNKEITVLDVCAEKPLRTIADAHKRSIHKVVLGASSASRFVARSTSLVSHLFASAGLDGAVTLWDLRQTQPVRQFALHRNAALTVLGLAFHPTGSLLAVGSEDRAVYLYDLANSTSPLDVIRCADVPTSIAFHPVDPVMAVGLASGAVALYAQQ